MKVLFIKTLRKLILSIFSVFVVFGFLFAASSINPTPAMAQSCSYENQCVGNLRCICTSTAIGIIRWYECRYNPNALQVGTEECGSAIIGGVDAPPAVAAINSASGSDIGIVFFISRLIQFANIVAGILVMINFVMAGFTYIVNAGSSSVNEKVRDQLTWSILGILLIVGSYSLAGIFGLVFYGDPTFIISPTLETALDQGNP